VSTQAVVEPLQTEVAPPRWSLASRVAFRFCVLYFGIYCLSNQILITLFANPKFNIPDPSTVPPLRNIILFTAQHLFHLAITPAFLAETGSGDRPCDWVLVFCMLVFAVAATVLWSLIDRKRTSYPALRKWFWLFFRYCLATQMFVYAFAKIVPLQMPFPPLTRLLEPFGNFSPMGVLWYSIGAAPAYEIFAGSAECLGGLLLLIPRTRTLGALVCLADMTQVFLLNMTYDVPVKLLSFHLILLSLLMLTPEMQRLLNFFVLNRPAEPSTPPPLFRSLRRNRIAAVVQVVFILWFLGLSIWDSRDGYKTYGAGVPTPPLYGIWDVEQQTVDGQVHPPLLTDTARWRRILVDKNNLVVFLHMNDERVYYSVQIDTKANTLKLAERGKGPAKITLTYTHPAPDQLIVDGPMDGHKLHLELRLYDRNKFLLVSRGFHWVQQAPFNR
jgi:uncharacterized membrane protein YphA (DoxX/SURF4 family)